MNSCISKYANEMHELFVKIDSVKLVHNKSQRALRFRAKIETESNSYIFNASSSMNGQKTYQNSSAGKIYRQLDEKD